MKVITRSLFPDFFGTHNGQSHTHNLFSLEVIRIHWGFRQPNHQGGWMCKYVNNVLNLECDSKKKSIQVPVILKNGCDKNLFC